MSLDEPGFWISKPWLKGKRPTLHLALNLRKILIPIPLDWRLAKPKMHIPYQDDSAPDSPEYVAHVLCEHGGLCPNVANRRRVSEEGAQIIRFLYPSWSPPSTDIGVCAVCKAAISKSHESNRGLRKQAEDEKVILTPIVPSVLMFATESLEAHVRP